MPAVRECAGANGVGVRLDSFARLFRQLGKSAQELGPERFVEAQCVVQHEHLAVGLRARANPDGGDAQAARDFARERRRHQLEDHGERTRVLEPACILAHPLSGFLFAALQAALAITLWVPWFLGLVAVPSLLPPVAWHAHSLLFGYVPAVIAGFLLTAVPNWTGRLPVAGWPLAGLFSLWLVGRLG